MEICIGAAASLTRDVTIGDIQKMAEVSGDMNPIHLNEEYAKDSPFGAVIAHGLFTVGMISALLGTTLPGEGTIILSENLRFSAPVYAGDRITATVKVSEIDFQKKRISVDTMCVNQQGTIVMKGSVMTKFPQLESL